MRRINFYYAKIRGSFINYLNLLTGDPIRLKDTKNEKESIVYSLQEIKILTTLHPEIEIELK